MDPDGGGSSGSGESNDPDLDTKCSTFNFAATGGNWREAGVNNIFLRIVWLDPPNNNVRVKTVYVNNLVVGFPLAYHQGTPAQVDLSSEDAAYLASAAFNKARSDTYIYSKSS